MQYAIFPFKCASDNSAELRKRSLFVTVDVAASFAQQFVSRFAVKPHSDLIRHGAGRHEDGRFLSQQHCKCVQLF